VLGVLWKFAGPVSARVEVSTEVSLLFARGLAFWPSLMCDLQPTLRNSAWNINTTEGRDNEK
jgi:hypothetical protein